ncbi:hypothetical protein ACQKFK_32455 [Bacillus mycoides]|uniref:hypothetical protein n=1 Tax=Bacillus mycoides TaxID=1405 RepID=UPI003D06A5BB
MERFNSVGTDKAVIESHILRIEEEFHFVLSLLQQDEIDELFERGGGWKSIGQTPWL